MEEDNVTFQRCPDQNVLKNYEEKLEAERQRLLELSYKFEELNNEFILPKKVSRKISQTVDKTRFLIDYHFDHFSIFQPMEDLQNSWIDLASEIEEIDQMFQELSADTTDWLPEELSDQHALQEVKSSEEIFLQSEPSFPEVLMDSRAQIPVRSAHPGLLSPSYHGVRRFRYDKEAARLEEKLQQSESEEESSIFTVSLSESCIEESSRCSSANKSRLHDLEDVRVRISRRLNRQRHRSPPLSPPSPQNTSPRNRLPKRAEKKQISSKSDSKTLMPNPLLEKKHKNEFKAVLPNFVLRPKQNSIIAREKESKFARGNSNSNKNVREKMTNLPKIANVESSTRFSQVGITPWGPLHKRHQRPKPKKIPEFEEKILKVTPLLPKNSFNVYLSARMAGNVTENGPDFARCQVNSPFFVSLFEHMKFSLNNVLPALETTKPLEMCQNQIRVPPNSPRGEGV